MFGLGRRKLKAVAFDIIGTVFPLEPLRPELVRLGFPPSALEGWFAAGLRDAFALAAVGGFKPFAQVLEEALRTVAAEQGLNVAARDRATVVGCMKDLSARPDAVEAFRLLADADIQVLALTNGSRAVTTHLLKQARLDGLTRHLVSVDEVKLSKPRAEVYRRAARTAGVAANELALLAAHPWDINGAKAAGLVTGYLNADRPFSAVMRKPDVEGSTLVEVARALRQR